MPRVKNRVRVGDEEVKLLTGLIVSTEFCQRVMRMVRPEHLQDMPSRKVLRWVTTYWEQYQKAPGREIRTIYDVEAPQLQEAEANVIEGVLAGLSSEYEDTTTNWAYQADLSRAYIRKRNAEVHMDQARLLVERGDLDQAEDLLNHYTTVSQQTSEWRFPLVDAELQHQSINQIDSGLFKMEGTLGGVFGWWQRGWLVALVGAYKVGKTWWLIEIAAQAARAKLNVAVVSIEMGVEEMTARFMMSATALPEEAGDVQIPVWDCAKNQDDTCTLRHRVNKTPPPLDRDDNPVFDPDSKYKPCTACMRSPEWHHEYSVATWFDVVHKPKSFRASGVRDTAAYAEQYGGGRIATISCPGATLSDVEAELDNLEARGFVPDVLVLDYADILAKEGTGEEWQQLDAMWQYMPVMAKKRHLLFVTASQGTSEALKSRTLRNDQVAGTRRKLGHVHLGISINQVTDDDKMKGRRSERAAGVVRLGTMVRRQGRTPHEQVWVLQALGLGQPAMDAWYPGEVEWGDEHH